MIFVTHDLPVNVPGEPVLGRSDVWDGLVLKANNAVPFVPSMTFCEVTSRLSETVFDRDIEFRGEHFTERITMEEPHRVTFTRIAGPVLGTIANEIEGPDDDLRLRFSFALVVAGVEGGSGRGAGVRRLHDRRLPQGRRGHARRHAPDRRGEAQPRPSPPDGWPRIQSVRLPAIPVSPSTDLYYLERQLRCH